MLQLCQQPALRATMSQKSLQRAKLFSWEKFMTQTLLGYQTSLKMQPL
jgi:hypothetical protein